MFQAILENATRICEAKFGVMQLLEAGGFQAVALHDVPHAYAEAMQRAPLFRPVSGHPLDRLARTKQVLHIPDARAERKMRGWMVELAGARTLLLVPMLKDNELIGVISIYRQQVRPFTQKQIELVRNFAAQAVIAIENTRLLNELREALEQQTATSEVLQVISTSQSELEPVFHAMLQNAVRMCTARFGILYRHDGQGFRFAEHVGAGPKLLEVIGSGSIKPHPLSVLGQIAETKRIVAIEDATQEHGYLERVPVVVAGIEEGTRGLLGVPMLRENTLVGALVIFRQEVGPFTEKQIALVQNFANQAVIAIENTRLLNELRQRTDDLSESLEQQTATSEVLRVISSSPSELPPVFEAMLRNAVRICDANFGNVFRWDGTALNLVAAHNTPPAYSEARRRSPLRPDPSVPMGRVIATKSVVHIADLSTEQGYAERKSGITAAIEVGGVRTLLAIPMLKEDELVGIITIYRQEVRPFTDRQVELVKNFAAQAVIAIENTRLLNELRQRTEDLSKSLDDLRTAQDRLVQTQKLASLGQLTAGIAHEIKNPLNFVNNFSGVSVELIEELEVSLAAVSADAKTRADISELTGTLRGNLEKVVQHGKRADAIVKNMLLHSRQGSGEHRSVDINALVEESLNLAYHGARAEKQGFEITLERSFDPATGEVDVFPQEITRALLNLISNGFYAATKRRAEAKGGNYEPALSAATKNLGNSVEIRIRDNGTGIPPEVREKLFNPFFTTKPAGEGTGLGLSICHDIIVKQHGGSIEVDTQLDEFTEFRIVLPRVGASR